jgi:cell wall-associated NlpC family hydrolase
MRCYESVGVHLPRDADQQAKVGRLVSTRYAPQPLRPGDLLFFMNRRGLIHHVAISLGGDAYIDAAGKQVAVRTLAGDDEPAKKRRAEFAFAKRVVE